MDHTCSRCGIKVSPDRAGGLCPVCLANMVDHPTAEPVNEKPLTPGQEFHGLNVLSLVARGGMGIVYKARHVALDRTVALKILPRRLASDAGFRQRFEREAKTLAGLTHPNIVGVHDLGIEGDLTFLVMEFVQGSTLRQLLRERRLPADQALQIAVQVCDALEYAHLRGVVHRDIKPDNILFDSHGTLKITDFGLAKMIGTEAPGLTESDLVIGTPHYMAPEQLERPKNVDHRADLYSVGVLLYEMLTGELPIGHFDPPSRKVSINPRLDEIVMRALAKEPDRRYQRAGELKAAVLNVVPALAAPAPAAHRRFGQNMELQCTCGWKFFVPGTSRGFVNCPSCHAPVPSSGTRPPTTRAKVEEKPRKRQSGMQGAIIAASGVLVLLGGILVVAIVRKKDPPPRKEPVAAARPEPAPPTRTTAPAPPPVPAAKEFIDYDHQIEQVVARCNLAGIVASVLLHTGRGPEHDAMQGRIREYEKELRSLVARKDSAAPLPPHFESGDRLVGFEGKTLDPLMPGPFAEGLKTWLGRFRAGVAEQAVIFRVTGSLPLEMRFPERTKELAMVAYKIGIILGELNQPTPPPTTAANPVPQAPPTAPPAPPAIEALQAQLIADLRARLAGLHPYYRGLLGADDSARMNKLLDAGKGTVEDSDFLRFKALPLLNQGALEYAEFGGKVGDLEAKLGGDAGAAVDTLHFKDGRKLEGTVEEETEESVKLKSRFGSVKFPRADIARIERGKGSSVDFRTRYASAKGKREELLSLVTWCKERNLAQPRELACWSVLLLDPGHERCRTEVGLGRTPGAADPSVQLKEGKIEWNGRLFTPEELRRELLSMGFVQVNGLWCEKVPKTFKIDNLYRDEGKYLLLGSGASVNQRLEKRDEMLYDVPTKSWVSRPKMVSVGRYLGIPQGVPGGGMVQIQVESPGDVIDCRVKSRAQVLRTGDYVTVSVASDASDPLPKVLYTVSAPGDISPTHDASEKVRGLTRFCIRAQISGGGMFLPCDSNTSNVLEVRYTYGKPLERLNATLGSRREGPALAGLGPLTGVEAKIAGDANAEQAINAASETAGARLTLTETMADMRRLTDGVVYSREIQAPPKFSQAASAIRDPLYPRLEELPKEQQSAYGSWYGVLALGERREFAVFYGLWCARVRYLQRTGGK